MACIDASGVSGHAGRVDTTTIPSLTLHPIGIMRTRLATRVEAPRQPAATGGIEGVIELATGLNLQHAVEDLAAWERIWVIFWFDRNRGWRPKVLPPRSTTGRKGVLATRSPHRPNPLGLSVLRLVRVEGLALFVRDVDLLDGTPILDIKPYVPYSDAFPDAGSGWLDPATPDPRTAWEVGFSALAEEQLAWIGARCALPLRDRIVGTLALGPQPHPYRRIRKGADGSHVLAVRDWRVDFTHDGIAVRVMRIRSGYSPAQLARAPASVQDPAGLHRLFESIYLRQ
jgi:tRNA-Thr(GGU) m(6)t(6)A37 methyltransferase TsaA